MSQIFTWTQIFKLLPLTVSHPCFSRFGAVVTNTAIDKLSLSRTFELFPNDAQNKRLSQLAIPILWRLSPLAYLSTHLNVAFLNAQFWYFIIADIISQLISNWRKWWCPLSYRNQQCIRTFSTRIIKISCGQNWETNYSPQLQLQ